MTRVALVLVVALLGGCKGPAPPPAPPAIVVPAEGLNAVAQRELRGQRLVGLGAGVIIDGRVAWLGGFGYADLAAKELLDPLVHQLRWASISKTVNGAMAARLAVAGRLDLDTQIRSMWDEAPAGPTVRQLLTHTGGVMSYDDGGIDPRPSLPDQLDPRVNIGFTWALPRWVGQPLLAYPGTSFRYSTLGHNLAGAAIGAAGTDAGEPADMGWMRQLGAMTVGTGAEGLGPDVEWAPQPRRAKGYRLADDGQIYDSEDVDVSWKLPGAGLISTVQVLAEWCAMLAGDRLMNVEAKAIAWAPVTLQDGSVSDYGLGFGLGERDGRRTVEHDGGQEKARTRLVLYPDEGLCFVAMTNTESASSRYPVEMRRVTDQLEDVLRASPRR